MKLSAWVIYLAGILFGLAILSYFLFWHFLPNTTAAGYWDKQKELLETEAGKQRSADKKLADAERLVDEKDKAWQVYVATRTPGTDISRGGMNLAMNPYQLTVEAPKYRNSLQKAINARLQSGGVKLVGDGPTVPETGEDGTSILSDFFNYPAMGFPVVILDLGTITVQGTYNQIKANVKSWANMPNYLAVADGLQLQGTSPILTGTYNLSIVGYVRGKDIYPGVPTGVGAGSTTASAPALNLPGAGGPGNPAAGRGGAPAGAGTAGASK